jgi:hypothetical protein
MKLAVNLKTVAACLSELRSKRIHEHFAGYLCLVEAAHMAKKTENLSPNFKGFHDRFLRVEDGPIDKPYIKPFISKKASVSNRWLNDNIAGSYAPSSIRAVLAKVVAIDQENGTYTLKNNHAELALSELLYGSRINIHVLAAFLFRDYSFESAEPSILVVTNSFAADFGYLEEAGGKGTQEYTKECKQLYDLEIPEFLKTNWSIPHE